MSILLGDNFSYQGAKPLDARLKYDTVAAMKAVSDSTLYDGCLAYCTATEKTYQWKSTNTVDTTLGRWREFSSGGSITVDDELSDTSTNPVQNAVIKEALDGKADLVDGKVPAAQLPSYVDDVLEYEDLAHFPATGEAGKIYVALDTNKTYRWSGSAYTEISESLALGETSSTAYRGDRGKTAYDDSQTNKTNIGTMSNLTTTDKTSLVAAINEVASSSGLQLGETSTTAYRGDRGKTAYDFSQTPYTSNPAMDGTASPGSSTAWAKGDHVHPSDTSKENTFRYATMPTASAANEGKIVQYIGATGGGYTNGFFYKCVSDGESTPTYSWSSINVQAGGGGTAEGIYIGTKDSWDALTTAQKAEYQLAVLADRRGEEGALAVGNTYTLNGHTFVCAEDLGGGDYALQANSSWQTAYWPGYTYNGGHTYAADFDNRDISPYVSNVAAWYTDSVKIVESEAYKYGPYLVPKSKITDYYLTAFAAASGRANEEVWTGTYAGTSRTYVVVGQGFDLNGQDVNRKIAPTFNVSSKKLTVDENNVITAAPLYYTAYTYSSETGILTPTGHAIVDTDDSVMTGRSNLKFGGDFSVTDDSTNDETEVAPCELTAEDMAEIMGTLPGTPTELPILFDETGAEYAVGWYKRASDGKKKPLYQKTITGTTPSTTSNSWVEVATVDSNMDECVSASFIIHHPTLGHFFANYLTIDLLKKITADGKLAVTISNPEFTSKPYKAVIQYTKTTDSWQ